MFCISVVYLRIFNSPLLPSFYNVVRFSRHDHTIDCMLMYLLAHINHTKISDLTGRSTKEYQERSYLFVVLLNIMDIEKNTDRKSTVKTRSHVFHVLLYNMCLK